MKKILKIVIGIPIFNEEANIKKLLRSLLVQKHPNFKLEKIIVINDGSIDDSALEVKKVLDKRITLVNLEKRVGLNKAQNEILVRTNSDVLLIINGDVLPENENFLLRLVKPFYISRGIGIVSAVIKPINKKGSFVEKVLVNAQDFKEHLFKRVNQSDNVYLCHGQMRAFSKNFYKKISWPDNCPEDSYSYLFCKRNGFKFVYLKDLKVNYQVSKSLSDHILQSNRFIYGIKKLEEVFDPQFIKESYKIPVILFAGYLIQHFLKNPIYIFSYIV